MREVQPDLLLAWGMRTAIVAPAATVAVDQRPALLVRHVDFLPGPSVARLMRAAVARADRVCVNSAAVGRDLDPDGSLGDRLAVISPGVHLPDYDAEWAMAPDPEVLLLGALVPWKRPDLALEAVARAAERRAAAAADGRGRAHERRGRAAARRPARAGGAARPGGPRRASPASSRTRARRSGAPGACCTAPTASRSATSCSRRSPAGGPWWRRRPAGRPRSWTRAAAGSTGPATPRRRRRRWSRCCPRPRWSSGSGRRARPGRLVRGRRVAPALRGAR